MERGVSVGEEVKGQPAAEVEDESRENKACGVFPSGHGITFPCNVIHAP